MKSREKYIDNQAAYNAADNRAKEASRKMHEQEKLESELRSKISSEEDKIDKMIMDTYEAPLMNESQEFLSAGYNSKVISSSSDRAILGGQLFYIRNQYRPQFDKFDAFLDTVTSKYTKIHKTKQPDYLSYGGYSDYSLDKKMSGEVHFKLYSGEQDQIKLVYDAKNEYVFKKDKVEEALTKLKAAAKEFSVTNDGKIIAFELAKEVNGDEALEKLPGVEAYVDGLKEEANLLLKTSKENGASTSKTLLFFNKVSNWYAKTKFHQFFVKHPKVKKGLKITGITLTALFAALVVFIAVGTIFANSYWTSYESDNAVCKALNLTSYERTDASDKVYYLSEDKVPAAKQFIESVRTKNKNIPAAVEITSIPEYMKYFKKYSHFESDGTTWLLIEREFSTRKDKPIYIDLIEVKTDDKNTVTGVTGYHHGFGSNYIINYK